jgi:Na+-driven multidrug efflux pump
MLQASVFQGAIGVVGGGLAVVLARGVALFAMVGVLASLGLRAILRQLQHTDTLSRKDEALSVATRWLHGLPGTLLALPLAAAALVATAPLLGFFR